MADYIWNVVDRLRRSQWLSAAEIERRQMQRLGKLIAHCRQHVAWYRQAYAGLDVGEGEFRSFGHLSRLPVVDRRIYQQRTPQFCAETLPSGMVATATVRTSGTSGLPIAVRQTNIVNLWWCALGLRDLEWSGIDPRGRLAVIRSLKTRQIDGADFSSGYAQQSWGQPLSDWIETGPSFALDIQCPLERQLGWLREVDPDVLLSYSANLDALAAFTLEAGTSLPRLKIVQSMAEPLTDAARRRIESAFGAAVTDAYSCQEVGYLASQCPETGRFHVHAENVILEVVDEAGRPVPPGGTGRVLLTGLLNYLTPLIRYEVGDEAVVGDTCPCGRGLPTLLRVHGKLRPMLTLSSGHDKSSAGLADCIAQVPDCRQYQVEQTSPTSVTLRVVPGDGWNQSVGDRLIKIIQEFFEAPVNVRIDLCDRIPPRSAGKTPAFLPLADGANVKH